MFEAIRSAIAARGGIADWVISETVKTGAERYYIGSATDMARAVETRTYKLSVYVDGGPEDARVRGEASISVHPTMSAAEIRAAVDRAAFAAAMSRNPHYELPTPRARIVDVSPSRFEGSTPDDAIGRLAEAAFSAQGAGSGARINSLELFLSRIERRIVNSRGVDAGWSVWSGYSEYTIEAAGQREPVELTDDFAFSEPDYDRLRKEIAAALEAAQARARAEPTPAGLQAPLLLSGKNAAEVFGWFKVNLSGSRIFAKSSPLALGESVHGPDARRGDFDPLNLAAEPSIPLSPLSAPFDGEGTPLSRTDCAVDGVARAIVGPARYAHYLGLPSLGDYRLFSVGPGSRTPEALRSGPHLEVEYFSDFVLDPDSGDFGGEIRLAWLSDGAGRRPVTGGSVTGSLLENRSLLRFSDRIEANGPMLGPEGVLLPRVSIAGV